MQFQQFEINNIHGLCEKLRWLEPYIVDAPNVVHFGCSIGLQTIALAWKFSSSAVMGLDIKGNNILQAQINLSELRKELGDLIPEECVINFEVQDVTLPTSLRKNYYDLAFADYVLYQIWFAEGGPRVSCKTKFAVSEMVRVVKPGGGYVAAYESRQHKDGRTLDFRGLFEQFNLTEVHVEKLDGYSKAAKYIYSKGI